MNKPIHKNMFSEKWYKFTLCQQLANIGSEFNRTLHWHEKGDKESRQKSFERLLELIDLTLSDKRWKNRSSEILRLREVICDLFIGGNKYNILPESLKNYFLYFGLKANIYR